MDDFIQIIVILFFVFSIFSSLFGKKKPQQQRRPQRIPQNRPGEVKTSPQPKYDTNQVLEELFGIKLPKTGNEYPETEKNYGNVDLETDIPSAESMMKVPETSVESESIKDIDYDNLATLESTKLQVEVAKKAITPKQVTQKKSSVIRNKFRNTSSIKDSILVAEILNKPKALRK